MLKRTIDEKLLEWKNRKHHPLIISGMRQIGKTFSVQQFGKAQYPNVIYLDIRADMDSRLIPFIIPVLCRLKKHILSCLNRISVNWRFPRNCFQDVRKGMLSLSSISLLRNMPRIQAELHRTQHRGKSGARSSDGVLPCDSGQETGWTVPTHGAQTV